MEVRREIPWTTLFIEGVAIVVSILLAFAIDAWWDQRKGRAEERLRHEHDAEAVSALGRAHARLNAAGAEALTPRGN